VTSNDHEYANERAHKQDPNETVEQILDSLSGESKNTSKIRGLRDSDATATDGDMPNIVRLKGCISVNDRDRMKHYYDKSASMIAPKPQDVPIF